MAEATDDEDDAPMPDAPLEKELIHMPPAPASAPRMSNLERCIALRLVTRARCPVCGVSLLSHASVVSVLCVLPRIPR